MAPLLSRWLMAIAAITITLPQDVSAFVPMTTSSSSDRRSVIKDIISAPFTAALLVTTCTIQKPQPALAVDRTPFAPIDTLLPAARVKVMIDRSVEIASKLVASAEEKNNIKMDTTKRVELLHELESLLLVHQNFNRDTTPMEVPQQPAQSYLNAYKEYRNKVSILEKPGAMLVQNGEIDAWKRLKRQEKVREDADEIRAALNYYTSNLNFNSDRIVLTGTKEEKSKLIREDRIPDVKTVIASDMGLRYLLRNDVLTACDDARAELKYQMKQNQNQGTTEVEDGRDLLEVLLAAQSACNKWFDLIDEKDTLAAIDIVSREK